MTAEWAQVWIGVAGLLGLGLTVYYARNAWKAAEATNKQTLGLFAAERRPWLSLAFDVPTAELAGTTAIGRLKIHANNIGLTAATDVAMKMPLALILLTPDEQALRSHLTDEQLRPMAPGVTVFPSQHATFEAEWRWENATTTRGEHIVYLHGWVAYRVRGDTGFHFTPFIQRCWFTLHPNDTFSGFGKRPHTISIAPL